MMSTVLREEPSVLGKVLFHARLWITPQIVKTSMYYIICKKNHFNLVFDKELVVKDFIVSFCLQISCAIANTRLSSFTAYWQGFYCSECWGWDW